MIKKELIHSSLTTSEGFFFRKDGFDRTTDQVCIEEVVQIYLNDKLITSLVASPMQYTELGAGFVVSEGLADKVDQVTVKGNTIRVYAHDSVEPCGYVTESSGGSSSRMIRPKISSSITIDTTGIFNVIDKIVSELWEKTGGAHCSVLMSRGELIVKSSDVGRHNTVDKVIGYALLNNVDLSSCVLGCTGRQPAGMVSKSINAGIPIVITKAATTREGIALADKAGLTLICRVKNSTFYVYTHPERVTGIGR